MAITFTKLTRPVMRKLESGGKVMEHGITFERLANGDGQFSVNFMVDGQRIHRVVGKETDGTTRTQAEEFIEKARQDAKEGRLNLPPGRKIALGFREAAGKYLVNLAGEGGKDLVMKRRRLNLHLVPFFDDKPVSKISGSDIERYKMGRTDEKAVDKAKVGTVNRELAALSHLFTKAVEWGWIDKRPAIIRRYREERSRITYLTVEQIQRLLDAARRDQNPQVYPFIMVGVETSMRLMEILSIRRENVDIPRRVIWIPQAKGGAREQPITQHLGVFLDSHIKTLPPGTPWLFPSLTAKDGHTVNISKAFRRAVEDAGLDPAIIVRHTLRHTAITHLVQAGVDLPTVKRISGHRTLAMVERYSHQNGEHIQAAMDKLEGRYSK